MLYAQDADPDFCGTDAVMKSYYESRPAMIAQRDALEQHTRNYVSGNVASKGTNSKYVIPMVFHVYGTTQDGFTITDSLIKTAVKWLNEDYRGLNADYNTVHNDFKNLRATLDIEFMLAKKDPAGNATTGILYDTVKSGYANFDAATNARIAADAWNNYKYLNVYVMADLYGDGDLRQSGVGTYPNETLFDENVARIVYNGKFLAYNNVSIPEFYSVLTHECGHFLNLIHTFQGGCTEPNDNVADTPPCTTAQGCHATQAAAVPKNCKSVLINSENYMDYNYTCYKMFTKGQVDRMTAALNTAPLNSLWQQSNLEDVGLSVNDVAKQGQVFNIFPNPTTGVFNFNVNVTMNENCTVKVTDLTGRTVFSNQQQLYAGSNALQADIMGQAAGIYLLHVTTANGPETFKIHLQ